jgi:hypothetical protein
LDKLLVLWQWFPGQGILLGSTAGYIAQLLGRGNHEIADNLDHDSIDVGAKSDEHNQIKESHDIQDDVGAVDGPPALLSIRLASIPGIFKLLVIYSITDSWELESTYPKQLDLLAEYINEPGFLFALKELLFTQHHPSCPVPDDINVHVHFAGQIKVFHSATTCFYSPSDLYGMYEQCI